MSEQTYLLEQAVLLVYQQHGLPADAEQQRAWDIEVDVLFRSFLVARCSAPPPSFASRARAATAYRRALRNALEAAQ